MNIVLSQVDLKDFSAWCADNLSVDFKDVDGEMEWSGDDGWSTMYFGGQRVMSGYSEGGKVKDYLVADTNMARQCYDLYLTWREYNA